MSLEVLVWFYSCSYFSHRGVPSLKNIKIIAVLIRGKTIETWPIFISTYDNLEMGLVTV